MARPSGPKVYCNGQWTQARFNSFIRSGLRQMTLRWAPFQTAEKAATTKRGFRRCAKCGEEVPVTVLEGGRRVKNVHKDHRVPVVDPHVGFTNWDDYITRLFCEADGIDILCRACHTEVTNEEKAIAKERRRIEKETNNND